MVRQRIDSEYNGRNKVIGKTKGNEKEETIMEDVMETIHKQRLQTVSL